MEFIYMNEDKINHLLICTVCKHPFTNPVFIPALDIRLCRECIPQASSLINTKLDNFSSLDGNIVHMNDQLLLQLLNQLPVQCIACEKTDIYRKDFSEHRLHECPKRIVQCIANDLKCPWSGPYEEYDEHVQKCTFEFLRPILMENATFRERMEKYDELFAKQQHEIEQLKSQIEQSTSENNESEQLQERLVKYDELFANQQTEIEQLKSQLVKYDELFTNEQNQIQNFKEQLERYETGLNRLQTSFGVVLRETQAHKRTRERESQESVSLQRTQVDDIQQLKDQCQQFKEQLDHLGQEPTSTNNTETIERLNHLEQLIAKLDNTEVIDQLSQKLDQLEQSIAKINTTEVVDQLSQRLDQLEQSIANTDNTELVTQLSQRLNQLEHSTPTIDSNEAVDQLKQQLDQFDANLQQMQTQYTEITNQFKHMQKQDSYRNNEVSYLRQCRDKQEVQICLLARKKVVVPRSYATIDPRIDDLIETYPKYADINLSNKHFDNQDLEAICKRAMFDKQCRKFRLENNEINSKGASVIADNLYGNLTLNELYLSDNTVSDIGAHALSQVLAINNYSLTWLELHSNNITDEGAEYLSEMIKTNKTLILLGLNSNKITNRGAQTLAGAVTYYNDTLQWLLLASNKGITDESIDNFNDMIVNNSSLQALWLKDCGLTKDGIRKLRESITSQKTNFVFET